MRQQQFIRKLLLCTYLMALFYVTLLAWNYGASLGPTGPGGRNYNIIPFRSIYRIAVFSPTIMDPIRILVGNIVLFLPMGFLLPFISKKLRRLSLVVLLAFLTSLLIEVSQFLFTHRVANIDDVILNTLGATIGYMVFYIVLWLKRRVVYIRT
ncbi:VanZ family protein [Halalkalibacter krulwichiae]|uniref:VanZ like family protein n=1 Tax=Halalkalibacter krulwichiae TaxID=199441 RepID=A0A1X9MBM1_9BACI|nr:VanZ family protein [Halalkalibacter krulwichiae]ARK30835.1 VanZ like family protein [Halalkalibacter krulwichiae]